MGIDPQMPFYDLNLAGAQGMPIVPATIPPTSNAPTFTHPDTSAPTLAPYDLTAPGIDLRPAFTADPLLPDLLAYAHPYGLDIQPNVPSNLGQADLLLPDMQHPNLMQQTHMQQRPGDLEGHALDVMHQSTSYQQLDAKTYPGVFMDQAGVNTTRSRHMDLLMRGLDDEEC